MDARNDLADARFYAGLFAKIGDIFARLANNDTGVLRAHERAEGEGVLRWWRGRAGLCRSAYIRVRKKKQKRG